MCVTCENILKMGIQMDAIKSSGRTPNVNLKDIQWTATGQGEHYVLDLAVLPPQFLSSSVLRTCV